MTLMEILLVHQTDLILSVVELLISAGVLIDGTFMAH